MEISDERNKYQLIWTHIFVNACNYNCAQVNHSMSNECRNIAQSINYDRIGDSSSK